MDDNNLNNQSLENGNITGFDSAEPSDTTSATGYTVTPSGGFYTKPREDIIQDEPAVPESHQQESAESPTDTPDAGRSAFRPTGSYGNSAPEAERTYQPSPNPEYRHNRPAARANKNGHSTAVVIVASVLAAVIGAAGGIAAIFAYKTDADESPVTVESQGTPSNVNINVDKTADSIVEAVSEKASASVVGIRTTTSVSSFFGGNNESTGEGSGVVYSSDGYIITNYHVIQSAVEASNGSKISVFLTSSDSTAYDATVVGYNISSDLAVLKIKANGLNAVEVGNSDELKIGQYVITIGSPGGLEFMGSVTYGVISGLNRVVSSASDVKLIQTDAAINPGNSGGALLNEKGQLIGINSSKIVSTDYEGMGFAIPVNTVVEKCKNIIERQNEPEPYTGITLSKKYSAEVLSYYGYPTGAVILSVDSGSPAETAGLRRGDIVTEFDGNDVESYQIFEEKIAESTPGKSVSIKIYRSGRYYSTELKIASDGAQ